MSLKVFLLIFVGLVMCTGIFWFVYASKTSDVDDISDIIRPFRTNVEKRQINVLNPINWEGILIDSGWNNRQNCRNLASGSLDCQNVSNIKLEYSAIELPYFKQQDSENSPTIASVNAEVSGQDMTIKIHVDRSKLDGTNEDDWWITHQVIRVLNYISNPELDYSQVMELDRQLFTKYSGKEILKLTL